ncbi:hypothetical protein FNV43_RR01287 [Rhamnella rubrinervis]|uniref:Protein ECERIFERUM 26-like n=1 Tax=Rhamnella rubrinervis TaxID=2594499 RepID=A0A8K0HR68_9ROSA|nr:hypothetical protein FNV43_RR01287 [Rhamnella rubrinervis]
MVFSKEESLVYDLKLSSVGPGKTSGSDVVHELSSMDLAMKLHYVRGVYFFSSQAVEGLTIHYIKETMFTWFNEYYYTCGRFRRSDSGRPFIKCNDCGARFIEARCDLTIDEWLEMKDWSSLQKFVSQQVIGPELSFSPPVLLQITYFKCGGVAFGFSWAHVLGDAFSAIDCINRWGQIMALHQPNSPSPSTKLEEFENPHGVAKDPLSLKQVDPVGDHWIPLNGSNMETYSFKITPTQITNLRMKVMGSFFESLCAIIWQCIAKVRQAANGSEPKTVTICKRDTNKHKSGELSNSLKISTVKAELSVLEANPKKLANLLAEEATDETAQIEEAVEKDQGVSDFIVYGANLTFLDWQETDLYGLEFQGHKPQFVSYTIQGVGDKGAVIVLPGPNDVGNGGVGEEGRLVTLILPEGEVLGIQSELKKNGLLLEVELE